eukprot:3281797-Pleurochrysis_carterae.AAC.1
MYCAHLRGVGCTPSGCALVRSRGVCATEKEEQGGGANTALNRPARTQPSYGRATLLRCRSSTPRTPWPATTPAASTLPSRAVAREDNEGSARRRAPLRVVRVRVSCGTHTTSETDPGAARDLPPPPVPPGPGRPLRPRCRTGRPAVPGERVARARGHRRPRRVPAGSAVSARSGVREGRAAFPVPLLRPSPHRRGGRAPPRSPPRPSSPRAAAPAGGVPPAAALRDGALRCRSPRGAVPVPRPPARPRRFAGRSPGRVTWGRSARAQRSPPPPTPR